MPDIELDYAVRDMAGRPLMDAGDLLNEETIRDIAARGREAGFDKRCLLRHGTFRSDLESFLDANPYSFIFDGPDGVRAHLDRIGEVPIPVPLIEALDYFRQADPYTYRHSLIVFALTTFMLEISFPGDAIEKNLLLVGPTHDIGKLLVPASVLRKKTVLTREERRLLEFHPVAGYVLASHYLGDHEHPAARIALNHHERRDGSGYPRGSTGVEPLVEMVAICDVYDALISSRPYRRGRFDNRTALEELSSLADTGALNWCYVQALIGRNRAGHPDIDQVDVSREKRGVPPAGSCYGKTLEGGASGRDDE